MSIYSTDTDTKLTAKDSVSSPECQPDGTIQNVSYNPDNCHPSSCRVSVWHLATMKPITLTRTVYWLWTCLFLRVMPVIALPSHALHKTAHRQSLHLEAAKVRTPKPSCYECLQNFNWNLKTIYNISNFYLVIWWYILIPQISKIPQTDALCSRIAK